MNFVGKMSNNSFYQLVDIKRKVVYEFFNFSNSPYVINQFSDNGFPYIYNIQYNTDLDGNDNNILTYLTTWSVVGSLVAAPAATGYVVGEGYFAGAGVTAINTMPQMTNVAKFFWWYGNVSNANTYYGTFSNDGNGFIQNTGSFIADQTGGSVSECVVSI